MSDLDEHWDEALANEPDDEFSLQDENFDEWYCPELDD